MIDIKNGEQIFVEKEGGRKYRLGSNGGKKYEDEKPKKQCDLPATSPPPPRHFPPPPPRHLPATSLPPPRPPLGSSRMTAKITMAISPRLYLLWQVWRRPQLDDGGSSDDQGRCRGGARRSTQNLSI